VKLGWKPLVNGVNLKVTQAESADPGNVGLPLTYTLTVQNQHAFRTATTVTVTDTLPASFASPATRAAGSGPEGHLSARTLALGPRPGRR
jgi:uncharacterized repeat protein (TIGR01451 family)